MAFKVVPIPVFLRDLKSLSKIHRSILREMDLLAQSLKINPKQGIPLGKDCSKIRLAIPSKGKGKTAGQGLLLV
jgi:mRNA-degrading endonuclease RelE of RelBE toxin-antitoxin system